MLCAGSRNPKQWVNEPSAARSSPLIQPLDGKPQMVFDAALPFGGDNFCAVQFSNVKAVDGRATFGADLGGGNIERQFRKLVGNFVEQSDAIFGLHFDDGAGVGSFV